ncbi:MAG: recombination mediator RecR [Rikenellaceae bacterium]
MSQLLDNLVGELSRLQGVGRRSALRIALDILRWDVDEADQLAGAIYQFRREVCRCERCNNISDGVLCPICASSKRDRSIVCVVEGVGDLMSIESTGQYSGVYHVLGGVISPISGITPSDLALDKLERVVGEGEVREVIMALPSTIEGETTQFYISRSLSSFGVRMSVISRGIGLGDELEYSDSLTIAHALLNRREL